jgi:glutamine synthetase
MAPNALTWGRDNRGAMLRVLGRAGDAGTRIENRIGEPSANPYLYIAAQIHAGLDGLERGLAAPPATAAPYATEGADARGRLPASLGEALDALAADDRLCTAFGAPVVAWLMQVKRSELARHDQAEDKDAWQAREYFSRF